MIGAERWQAIVAGVGGQGVLFVTRLLADIFVRKGRKILISEVHGMAQRGGSVVSHLKAGDFSGPLVPLGRADLLLSLEGEEALRNMPFLAAGGRLVVNAAPDFFLKEDQALLSGHRVQVFAQNVRAQAQALGLPKMANVLLLAKACRAGHLPVFFGELEDLLRENYPPHRQEELSRVLLAAAENFVS